jgi:hypothetical protein
VDRIDAQNSDGTNSDGEQQSRDRRDGRTELRGGENITDAENIGKGEIHTKIISIRISSHVPLRAMRDHQNKIRSRNHSEKLEFPKPF